MSQNITFKIQDIKCDHLPKPAEAWIKQVFSVKLLLGGKEYSTGPINGSTTTLWSSKITLQAPESSSLEVQVHNRANGRSKLIGSSKDTVHNLLKESSSETVVRTLRRIDRPGVGRGANPVELTFSIALLSQDGDTGLLVSSFEELEQPDTFRLFVGTAEWTRNPKEQEEDVDMYVEVSVDGAREVHRTKSAKTTHCWDQDVTITARLESTVRIEIKSGAHISSKSLSVARVETSVKSLLEICADGDLAALELTLTPLVPATMSQATLPDGDVVLGLAIAPLVSGMVDPAVGTGGHMGSKSSAADSIGLMTVKLCRLSHEPPNILQLRDTHSVSVPQMGQVERTIPEEAVEDHFNLGRSYHARFARLGDLADLGNMITSFGQALALTPDSHPRKAIYGLTLGTSYYTRFKRLGELADVDNSIASLEQALALTPDGHSTKPSCLAYLGDSYYARFYRLGDPADVENSIANLEKALALTPDRYFDKPTTLTNLGGSYRARFDRRGDLADVENSIASFQQALALTPDGHSHKPAALANLGGSYRARFERCGDLADIENSIASLEQALALTPDGHSHKPERLTNLGISYSSRFNQRGDLADVENSIASLEQALVLTPDGHSNKLVALSSLGGSYHARFERLGDLADVENSIASSEQAVALTPDDHSDKPATLLNLSNSYRSRFDRLGDLADVDNSIASLEKALALTPDRYFDKPAALANLGGSYRARFNRLGELVDVENSIASLEKALALTPDGHSHKPATLTNLGASYYAHFNRRGDLADVENSIASLEQALALTPDGHSDKPMTLSNLGISYRSRFNRLGDLADVENSISSSEQAVALTPDGHSDKPGRLSNLGISYSSRFKRLGDLVDVENSITSFQQALALTPDGHSDKPVMFANLGNSCSSRFERLGHLADVNNSIASLEQALALTPNGHSDKPATLTNLGHSYHLRFDRLGDLADIENSIASLEKALALTPDGHSHKPAMFTNLGNSYQARFMRLEDLADLENSITRLEKALALTPDGHSDKPAMFANLGDAQIIAFHHDHAESHLHSAVLNMRSAAQSPAGSPHTLLEASRSWARLSLGSRDIPSALAAFRTAIEILPQVAWLGLDIASRQDWLAKEKPEELGCMAATCAIRLGRFEEAVELLDMARSVFWQQASSVRSGLQDLMAEQPVLAEELDRVSKRLDTSSFSGLSTSNSDAQLLERRLADHRGLVLKRESLIKQIRSLPGFEFFLKPTPFNRLREAAAVGHVVIINISKLGTDALVFDSTNPIRHVPLSRVDVAKSFKHTLTQTRGEDTQLDLERSLTLPEVLDSIKVDALKPGSGTDLATSDGPAQRQERADVTEDRPRTLAQLPRVWEHVLKPIFTEVGIPLERVKGQVPSNRIFWYLTGPLTFTAIHAASPASQLVVSSYVTTLSSLAEAQKRQSEVIDGPPMLLVISQPDTPGKRPIPQATAEGNKVAQTVSAAGWPAGKLQRFDRAQATVDEVSTALNTCSWVHFACHAMQDTSEGMESAIALYDGRLKLSAIAAKRLASARFAFLSTCESASGLQDSPGEAIHISAGMQFAGFSSVIATMWSIQDKDAPVIAEHTYWYLLRNGLDKVDLTEAAAALHYAVSRLREDSTVTMERWAPFVYYGV